MKHLGWAIWLFVALDLATFSIGFSISRQVGEAAVAINLAGRQRMLSQRITKSALVAADARMDAASRAAAREEAAEAYRLFQTTLLAFAEGGRTLGGDGQPVQLKAAPPQAAGLVSGVRASLQPWPTVPALGPDMERFAGFIRARNLEYLEVMNQLTTELERQSVTAVSRLQIAQAVAFVLSLLNFFAILQGLHRARQRVEEEAVRDHLTGLMNRAGLYRSLEGLLASASRSGATVGVMLFDLDNFKAINDSYGHAVGDQVLVEVARRVNSWKSDEWLCGRLGGDEFVMLVPATGPERLTRLAQDVEKLLAGVPAGDIVASASVGWALSAAGSTSDQLISAADTMMYVRKAERRVHRSYRSAPRTVS